jgi:RNA polymerase sigma factor (sigma-70 family)
MGRMLAPAGPQMGSIVDMARKARLLLQRRGASPEDAEDLVQEAFLRLEAYTRAHEVEVHEAFLVRTAVNLSVDQNRRARRAPFDRRALDLDLVADASPRPDEVFTARERLRRAQEGLMQLSPRARRILLGQRLDGLSHAELARQEEISVSAVEKHIARRPHA